MRSVEKIAAADLSKLGNRLVYEDEIIVLL